MANRYPQVAVLGCENLKTNLYYDVQEQVWKEDTMSSCVNNEENILKFCQQVRIKARVVSKEVADRSFDTFSFQMYPLLQVGNVVRLDTILRFDNWCELSWSKDNPKPRCRTIQQAEESVQPFRCLHPNSALEDSLASTPDCLRGNLGGSQPCLRAEKWEQLASLYCSNQTMILSSSLNTLEWCGLAEFRGVEFICCPLKGNRTTLSSFLIYSLRPLRRYRSQSNRWERPANACWWTERQSLGRRWSHLRTVDLTAEQCCRDASPTFGHVSSIIGRYYRSSLFVRTEKRCSLYSWTQLDAGLSAVEQRCEYFRR